MKQSKAFRSTNTPVFFLLALFAFCLCPIRANADLILAVQSASANASTTANSLDITLTNTGSSSLVVAGFAFEVFTPSSNIIFMSATTDTANSYLFDGNSFVVMEGTTTNSTSAPGQTLDASDLVFTAGSGTTIAPNATFGVGHLFFDVGAASGIFAVTLNPSAAATNLSDPNGSPLLFDISNGQIDVTGGTVVPEPSSMILLATGVCSLAIRQRKLKR